MIEHILDLMETWLGREHTLPRFKREELYGKPGSPITCIHVHGDSVFFDLSLAFTDTHDLFGLLAYPDAYDLGIYKIRTISSLGVIRFYINTKIS